MRPAGRRPLLRPGAPPLTVSVDLRQIRPHEIILHDPSRRVPCEDASMIWTAPPVVVTDGPMVGEDRPILEAYLAFQRSTLLSRCAGLTGDQLAQPAVPPSNLTLLGLIRHMAKVERIWFRERIGGEQLPPMYDPAHGKDADFTDLDPELAADDYARLLTEARLADAAMAARSFDDTIGHGDDVMSVRMVYLHMSGEYAQHNGHADLIRERLDGTTG
jgi:hypothetical protein